MLAQTIDSGSNNNTMASTMYELINDNNDGKGSSDTWDPLTIRVVDVL
jgi:hypothetical protein